MRLDCLLDKYRNHSRFHCYSYEEGLCDNYFNEQRESSLDLLEYNFCNPILVFRLGGDKLAWFAIANEVRQSLFVSNVQKD